MSEALNVADCIFFRLAKTSQAATRYWGQRTQELDVTAIQGLVLNLLREEDGITSRHLGDKAIIDSATLTGIIDRLAAADLLTRQPSPSDRRANLIFLTAKGRALAQQLHSLMEEANREFSAGLSQAEHHSLMALLRRLQDVEAPPAPAMEPLARPAHWARQS